MGMQYPANADLARTRHDLATQRNRHKRVLKQLEEEKRWIDWGWEVVVTFETSTSGQDQGVP